MSESSDLPPTWNRYVRVAVDMEVEIVDQAALEAALLTADEQLNLINRGAPGVSGNDFRVSAAVSDLLREVGFYEQLEGRGLKLVGASTLPRVRTDGGKTHMSLPEMPARNNDGSFADDV